MDKLELDFIRIRLIHAWALKIRIQANLREHFRASFMPSLNKAISNRARVGPHPYRDMHWFYFSNAKKVRMMWTKRCILAVETDRFLRVRPTIRTTLQCYIKYSSAICSCGPAEHTSRGNTEPKNLNWQGALLYYLLS